MAAFSLIPGRNESSTKELGRDVLRFSSVRDCRGLCFTSNITHSFHDHFLTKLIENNDCCHWATKGILELERF